MAIKPRFVARLLKKSQAATEKKHEKTQIENMQTHQESR